MSGADRRANGALKRRFDARFAFVDHEGVPRVGLGRTFVIDGRSLELFPIGVLCGVIHRSRKAIYKWEEHFGFPRALYRVEDDLKCNRWYSRSQLEAIRALYVEFGSLAGKHRNNLGKFIYALKTIFYTLDVPSQPRGVPAVREGQDHPVPRPVSGLPPANH